MPFNIGKNQEPPNCFLVSLWPITVVTEDLKRSICSTSESVKEWRKAISANIHFALRIESEKAGVVLPDSKTVHNGSMYSSSVATGNFEQFIAHDLVAYIG